MATRHTTSTVFLRRNHTKIYCLTCGRERLRSGNLGALQPPHYCSQACYSRYRAFSAPSEFARTGAGYGSTVIPTVPGGISTS